MRPLILLTLMGVTMSQASGAEDSGTTIVRNGNGVSIVTQSGDPAEATVQVEQSPGRTTIYRRSGGNVSVVTQSNDLSGIPRDAIPPEWRRRMCK